MSFFSEGRVGRGRGRGKGGISKGRRMLRGHHCGPRFVLYILVHAIVSTTSFFFFFFLFFYIHILFIITRLDLEQDSDFGLDMLGNERRRLYIPPMYTPN